ncbi:C39 family peptidase [Bacillota bacterium Lsc_1132]
MSFFIPFIIGSILSFGFFFGAKSIMVKAASFFFTITLLIAAMFSLVTDNVEARIWNTFKKNNLLNSEEKTKNEAIKIVKIKDQVLLNAPVFKQYPELPRGCEVTALAMLLQYKGINVDKMELAEKVKKDATPLVNKNGSVFWGNPNDGFIGNMYTKSEPGYGVYHKPIKQLAEQYLPGQVIDLTGKGFSELETYLSSGVPVWVITNTTFRKLPESAIETWETPKGKVKITYKEHAVIITGYDQQNIYFNDPISGTKNMAISKQDFLAAWQQMGSQAITYINK